MLKLFFAQLLIAKALCTLSDDTNRVKVNKCCEPYELYVEKSCTHINKVNETSWSPLFTAENGRVYTNKVDYELVIGLPDCGSRQRWPIYHYQNSSDVLRLLPNGVLRHYTHYAVPAQPDFVEDEVEEDTESVYYDYPSGKYCLEKSIENGMRSEYAVVCMPEYKSLWTNTEFLMRNIVSPITHVIAMVCLLIVAIVYFVMPTLRDLVGNIVTTISLCLIVNQAADLIRLLTVFTNHVSLIITDTVCYVSLLGAFFWLNSLGYYIWKTFKSRNVYLRITDGKKYCYYSVYAWLCTAVLGVLAVVAHFMLDYPQVTTPKYSEEQETIGSLGIVIFFVPIAFLVLANVFFFVTTIKVINRMNTYGRIHHKLRHSLRMFLLLFLVMTLTWLFFLLSFSNNDGLLYSYIAVNALQAPLILYICVFNQRHVSYLLRKSCCYENCVCACCRPEPECEWGDEMTAMNTGMY